jgi:hypothetical protein
VGDDLTGSEPWLEQTLMLALSLVDSTLAYPLTSLLVGGKLTVLVGCAGA